MNKEKRIYSLNEACFLIYKGCTDYKISKDEVNKSKCYFTFPETQEIEDMISEYRDVQDVYVNIKQYNRIYKKIRQEIYKMRMGDEING